MNIQADPPGVSAIASIFRSITCRIIIKMQIPETASLDSTDQHAQRPGNSSGQSCATNTHHAGDSEPDRSSHHHTDSSRSVPCRPEQFGEPDGWFATNAVH